MLLFISMCFLDLITVESHSCSCCTSMQVLTPAEFLSYQNVWKVQNWDFAHTFWIKYHLDPAMNVGFGERKCDCVCCLWPLKSAAGLSDSFFDYKLQVRAFQWRLVVKSDWLFGPWFAACNGQFERRWSLGGGGGGGLSLRLETVFETFALVLCDCKTGNKTVASHEPRTVLSPRQHRQGGELHTVLSTR